MKKTCFILFAFILFVIFSIQNVYAIDLNLINSVRENEIESAENLTLDTRVNNTTNDTYDDDETLNNTYDNATDDEITNNSDTLPSTNTNVSNVTSAADGTLTIANILNILLVVVGFLLILLGIAILIRINR